MTQHLDDQETLTFAGCKPMQTQQRTSMYSRGSQDGTTIRARTKCPDGSAASLESLGLPHRTDTSITRMFLRRCHLVTHAYMCFGT